MSSCYEKSLSEKIDSACSILGLVMAFAIPFIRFAPVPTILFSLTSLVSWVVALSHGERRRPNMTAVLLLAFWVVSLLFSFLVGLSFADFSKYAFGIRLPLLILPLGFLFLKDGVLDVKKMLRFFALGSVCCAIVILMVMLYTVIFEFEGLKYSYKNVSLCVIGISNIFTHRSYLSMNLLTALIVFFCCIRRENRRSDYFLFFCTLVVLSVFIYLSGSRISVLCLVLVLSIISVVSLQRVVSKYVMAVIIVGLMGLGFLILLSNERASNTILSVFNGANISDLDPRFFVWRRCFEVLGSDAYSFFGMGLTYASNIFPIEGDMISFMFDLDKSLNPHNQFLDVLIESGVVGLLLFVAALVSIFFNKRCHNTMFRWIWFTILIINLLFESMLDRTIGTYPIVMLLLLVSVGDESRVEVSERVRRWLSLIVALLVMGVSIKYMVKDKTQFFSTFMNGVKEVDYRPDSMPEEIMGFKMFKVDSTCVFRHTLKDSIPRIDYNFKSFKLAPSDTLVATLYAYTDKEYNGYVIFSFSERSKMLYGKFYERVYGGEWQKLELKKDSLLGNVDVFLDVSLDSNTQMRGIILFTEPVIEVRKMKK